MQVITSQPSLQGHSDEVDLFELFQRIWSKKFTILIFLLGAVVLSTLYAFTAKQQWTSHAYVNAPRLEQVKAYLDRRRAFARVDGNQAVDPNALLQTLFSNFIALSASERQKKEYLVGTDYYKTLLADADNHRVLLNHLSRQALKIRLVDKNQIVPYYEISFSAESPETA